MKNPNGYGSVVKLSGNRRNPYMVRKTVGWTEKGYPIYLPIGYAKTREEGNILLAQYNNSPWDIDQAKITFIELFQLWKEKRMVKLGKSNQTALCSAVKHCKKIYDMKYRSIKSFHMQDCVDQCDKSYAMKNHIKNLFFHLDRLALALDILEKTYSSLVITEPTPETTRTRFSEEEMNSVWNLYERYQSGENFESLPVQWIDTVLIFLYSGFRISELLNMRVSDIDLEQGIFKGGVKTDAGKNRIVPIHSLIFEIVKNRTAQGNEFFLSEGNQKLSSYTYRKYWKSLMDYLKIDKTPHECRHTFESLLDSAGANRKCIDMMMGHASKDIGNRTYNHKTLKELKMAIELVTC